MALTQISTQGIKDGTITGTDLATNVDLVDNQKLRLGAGNDLEIYHDGTDSRIVDSGTGELRLDSNSLRIRNAAGTETSAVFVQDGACELRFNNVKKFETTSDGAEVDGLATNFTIRSGTASGNAGGFINFKNVDGNGQPRDVVRIKGFSDGTGGYGELTLQTAFNNTLNDCLVIKKEKNIELPNDNQKLKIGAGQDLQIYHDGTSSRIENATGALTIKSDTNIGLYTYTGTELLAKFIQNGSAELYYDNSKKFETTSSGVTVTGTINFGSGMGSGLNSNGFNINFADSNGSQDMAKFGTGGDLRIYHDSANSYIQNITGALRIYNHVLDVRNDTGNETILKGSANGSVELYYNNVKKLETTDVGITSLDTLITQGELRPGPDNDHSIGRSNRRYITIFAVNGSINTSDKNEKNTIIDSDLGLDFINKLKPKSYKWNKNDGKTHYGLIAQDLEETLTSLGKTIADFGGIYKEDDSPMGLGYSELIAPLIKAVQELSTEVAALKAG